LIDGCRLSRASTHVYAHRDIAALRALLGAHRSAHRRAMIVTDGLFSMDGDRAAIEELVSLAQEFDAWTYVDDAHAVGATGPSGHGTAETAGLHGRIDVTMGTLGKAFGTAGAFVYGSTTLCAHLLNHARSFVFSTAMLPAQAAASREAIRIVRAEPARRTRLLTNVQSLRAALGERGIAALGEADSHIVPVTVGDTPVTLGIAATLRASGVLVGAVRPPTIAQGARLRISVSAAHTESQIAACVGALAGLVPRT
jgi:7-keto-8-aminopelargonate synthetase-like enzyme